MVCLLNLLDDVWAGGECAYHGWIYVRQQGDDGGVVDLDTYGTCNRVCNDGPIQTNITLHTGGIGAPTRRL